MIALFTSVSAYAAVRAAFSTDFPHLLAYVALSLISAYVSVAGIEASGIDD